MLCVCDHPLEVEHVLHVSRWFGLTGLQQRGACEVPARCQRVSDMLANLPQAVEFDMLLFFAAMFGASGFWVAEEWNMQRGLMQPGQCANPGLFLPIPCSHD